MAFTVGISILVSTSLVQNHAEYAHWLLEYFIESARVVYRPEFLVYNVHSLIHITDGAKELGQLFSIWIWKLFTEVKQIVGKESHDTDCKKVEWVGQFQVHSKEGSVSRTESFEI